MGIKEIGKIRKKTVIDLSTGTTLPDITPITVFLSEPNGIFPSNIIKEDVWGKWNNDFTAKLSNGMIVASSNKKCPIFKDVVPYKSVTAVCAEEQKSEVIYWLEYVLGANCVSLLRRLENGAIAIRANYQCW